MSSSRSGPQNAAGQRRLPGSRISQLLFIIIHDARPEGLGASGPAASPTNLSFRAKGFTVLSSAAEIQEKSGCIIQQSGMV
jgi:hypothetical protein